MKKFLSTAAFLALIPTASFAEPAVGVGLTFKFGPNGGDPGIALRLFSDNRRDRVVGTLGLDYLIRSFTFRPTLGASYVGDDTFFGIDFGLGGGFGSGGINTGFSGGYVNTLDPTPPVVTPPVTPPVVTPPVTPPVVTPPVTPPVVTPPVVTPPVVTPPVVTPPVERPPGNAAFLEEDNIDIIIGGETDFA